MSIEFESLGLGQVTRIRPRRHQDPRGYFSETWNARDLAEVLGSDVAFVQDNQSCSVEPGTIRGLHWQCPPYEQAKLVRVLRGRIYDVAVDVRPESPTFGQWVGAELSSETGDQLWIPRGFAHGFCTLEPQTEVFYKADSYYCAHAERGLRFDDVDIGINWPLQGRTPVLSKRDMQLPTLSSFEWPLQASA